MRRKESWNLNCYLARHLLLLLLSALSVCVCKFKLNLIIIAFYTCEMVAVSMFVLIFV